MAGEYGLAQRLLDEGINTARAESAMDEGVFASALMTQVIEHCRKNRTVKDIVSELEQHIRLLRDGDDMVVGRGE